MAVLLYYEACMEKDKNVQKLIDRLKRNIEECEQARIKMEQVAERYQDALNDVEVLRQTYDSLIATHNRLIDQFMEETNK